jgi:predicted AAA+ superfamily ATPase
MLERWLQPLMEDPALDPKMRFIAGPRQCGKTTLGRSVLARHGSAHLWFNWDIPETRRLYREDTFFYRAAMQKLKQPWACFDEIHKQREWKNILKGIYDADGERLRILVTGSARLELFRRSGDSLAGRFFLFRLSPVLLGELLGRARPSVPPSDPRNWVESCLYPRHHGINSGESKEARDGFDQLYRFGPFPEPLLKAQTRFASLWRRNYLDAVIRGDLRDLSRVRDLDLVEALIALIPWRVGAPFSVNSVREDLQVAHATVKNMMRHLERLLVTFSLAPYSRKVTRPVKRERKVYLYDWTSVEDPGTRFENLVALELLGRTHLWTETGSDEWDLQYVRTREGRETDFVLLRQGKPWCLLECKSRRAALESHHLLFARKLGGIPVVQLVREHGVLRAKGREVVSVSAGRFLSS